MSKTLCTVVNGFFMPTFLFQGVPVIRKEVSEIKELSSLLENSEVMNIPAVCGQIRELGYSKLCRTLGTAVAVSALGYVSAEGYAIEALAGLGATNVASYVLYLMTETKKLDATKNNAT